MSDAIHTNGQSTPGAIPVEPKLDFEKPKDRFIGTSHVKAGTTTNVVTFPKSLLKLIVNADQKLQEKELDFVLISQPKKDAAYWQLFTLQAYNYLVEYTRVNPKFTEEQRKYAEKKLAANARHIELDSQGRFSMPKEFIDEKFGEDKEKDIVLEGAFGYIKVWAKKDHDAVRKAEEQLEETTMKGVMKNVLDF